MQNYDICKQVDTGKEKEVLYQSRTLGLHRLDGPAKIVYNESGDLLRENYFVMNRLNRTDGPAAIEYEGAFKQIRYVGYHVDDLYHRLDGPARIWYHPSGDIKEEQYYIKGNMLSTEDYKKIIASMENKNKEKTDLEKFIEKLESEKEQVLQYLENINGNLAACQRAQELITNQATSNPDKKSKKLPRFEESI